MTADSGVAYVGAVELAGISLPLERVDVRTVPPSVTVHHGSGSSRRTVAHMGARAVFVAGELLVELANGDTVVVHHAAILDH